MPKRHPPEVRAQAIAAVTAGEQPAAVAKRLGISKSLVHAWWVDHRRSEPDSELSRTPGAHVRARERAELIDLVTDFVAESITTLSAQARIARERDWVLAQDAAGLGQYRGVELDRLIRILNAFRPAEEVDGRVIEGRVSG